MNILVYLGILFSWGASMEKATFAGGCFWCMEQPFEVISGVIQVTAGYIGGSKENPTYKEVCTQTTGHVEAVEITFDPKKVSYEELLKVFWRNIDPTDGAGQFGDRGASYVTKIFYHSEDQKKKALNSKMELNNSKRFNRPVVTEIVPASKFFAAEDYHQNYYQKNQVNYKNYRVSSGRDQFLDRIWKKNKLTPLQYQVTQQNATEPPFKNEYWDNERPGIYVDVVSGEPLFSSLDKFKSSSGWPSFTKPLIPQNITQREDSSLSLVRTEVRSKEGDSHLGHVFNDGPGPTGMRYCINSAAIRFIPVEKLEEEGFGQYKHLFEK